MLKGGSSSDQVFLTTGNNVAYTSNLYIGKQPDGKMHGNSTSRLLLDTTSSWLSVKSSFYDKDNSTTGEPGDDKYPDVTSIKYQNFTLNGSVYKDKVCLSPGNDWSCLPMFTFFLADEVDPSTELVGIDGVLGLGPNTQDNSGPSFIKTLYDSGRIYQPLVSFNYNFDDRGQSYIVLGENAFSLVGDHYNYKLDTSKHNQWSLPLTQTKYGGDFILTKSN